MEWYKIYLLVAMTSDLKLIVLFFSCSPSSTLILRGETLNYTKISYTNLESVVRHNRLSKEDEFIYFVFPVVHIQSKRCERSLLRKILRRLNSNRNISLSL